MDIRQTSVRHSQNLSKHWPGLCLSCQDVISSILSIGEPSYLGEQFEESFDYNCLLDSPFDHNEFVTEIAPEKTEVINIQNPEVTTTVANGESKGIQSLVEAKDIKVPAFQETNWLDKREKKIANISEGNLFAPSNIIIKDVRKRCTPNCNTEDLGDKIEGSAKYKISKLENNNTNPEILNTTGNENTFNISNSIQEEMSDEESKRIIEEFREECNQILNLPEITTLPSIEQYKTSNFINQNKHLDCGSGLKPSRTRTIRRTDPSVGAILLSTFTNAEKRTILDRRKKILLIVNRLLNLTSYINSTAKMNLGQMSGVNTFNNAEKVKINNMHHF